MTLHLFLFVCLNTMFSKCRLFSSHSMTAPHDDPLCLRQLLWLDDELFLAVGSGPLPSSSTVQMLCPAQDDSGALVVRSANKTT